MILDLERFLAAERPFWLELERLLAALAARPGNRLSLAEAERLRLLYERAAGDLNRAQHGAPAPELVAYLERLVAAAYGEIYQSRPAPDWRAALRGLPRGWRRFPRVFRRHFAYFALALGITLGGALLGALAVRFDPAAVPALLPADYLRNPARRVAEEESGQSPAPDAALGAEFSAFLMTHNIRVAILALFLGLTLGLGTGYLLFTNGVLLGAVAARYAAAGFGEFLAGWLLPHGVLEIPAILIAGQGGFLIAAALVRGGRQPRWMRLRLLLPDLVVLIAGVAGMLVWAGLVEGMFSQHQAPQIAYSVKIAVGLLELSALILYLWRVGTRPENAAVADGSSSAPNSPAPKPEFEVVA